jgi:hypothetical protein
MRQGIIWMGAIVALCSFTASHAEDAREFNAQLEQACLRKPDNMFGRTRCMDFATQAKAHTESARQK